MCDKLKQINILCIYIYIYVCIYIYVLLFIYIQRIIISWNQTTVPATPFDETGGDEEVNAAKGSWAQRRRRTDLASQRLVREDDDDEDDSIKSRFKS